MITLVVTYCMLLNPTMCRQLEVVPETHEIVSVPECIKGGAIFTMTFTLEHAEWKVRGYRCVEQPTAMQAWLKERVRP